MTESERVIHIDPQIMGGTAVFVGTRVPFETLLAYLKSGQPVSEFLEDFPTVTQEQAFAALEQAKEALLARVHSATVVELCPKCAGDEPTAANFHQRHPR